MERGLTSLQQQVHDVVCTGDKHGPEYCLFDGVMMGWIVAIERLIEEQAIEAYHTGLVALPAVQRAAREAYARRLRDEGKTIREIVKIMGFKSPGSVSWLLRDAALTSQAKTEDR